MVLLVHQLWWVSVGSCFFPANMAQRADALFLERKDFPDYEWR